MDLLGFIFGWMGKRKSKGGSGREEAPVGGKHDDDPYGNIVVSVLEQFISSTFPDSRILKTGPEEWELRHTTDDDEVFTDIKIQLNFYHDQPKSFVCVYYALNRMHMRQAPLKRDALVAAIRHCISA